MILVTGATGHVGSELVRLLAKQGAPARAADPSPAPAGATCHRRGQASRGRARGQAVGAMAGADAPVVFSRWHGQIEQHLAQSGLAYSLLRPSSFMRNFLMSAQQVAERLAAATGRQVRSVDLGPDSYRHALAGAGMPGWLVDGVVEGNTTLAAGHGATVTDGWPG
jgi:uncharacterized protein YbjT (DUF2867 family)